MTQKILLISVTFLVILTDCVDAQEVETLTRYRRIKLAEEYFEQGMQSFEKDKYEQAINALETSVSLDPNNYLAYFYLGNSYENILNYDKALLNFNLSLGLRPDFAESLFSRAYLYYKTGKYEKAADDFRALLTLPPGETQAIYYRGVKYGENDQDTGFDALITMHDKNADLFNSLGQCYLNLKKYDSALLNFSRAIQLSPDNDNFYINRGQTYQQLDSMMAAKKDYLKALSINSRNSLARINLAVVDINSGGPSPIDQLNQLIRNNPGLSFAYADRAYYKFEQGDYTEALQDYDSAIRLDPGNFLYYLHKGMTYDRLHDLNSAIKNFHLATTLNPSDYRAWYNLGNSFYKKGDYQNSISYYSKAIEIKPSHGPSYYNRGLAYFYTGNASKACHDLNLALQNGIENASVFLQKNCADK